MSLVSCRSAVRALALVSISGLLLGACDPPPTPPASPSPDVSLSADSAEPEDLGSEEMTRPTTVGVHVRDEDGRPLVGARITGGLASTRSDTRGDGRLDRISDERLALSVRLPGYVPHHEELEPWESPAQRVLVTLLRWTLERKARSEEILRFSGEGWDFKVPGDALRGWSADSDLSTYTVRWRMDSSTRDAPALFSLELEGERGEPLWLPSSDPAQVSVRVSDAPGDCSARWSVSRKEAAAGLFLPDSEVLVGTTAERDGCWVTLDLWRGGQYAVDDQDLHGCLELSVAGLDPALAPVEVRVDSEESSQQRAVTSLDEPLRWEHLRRGDLWATLLVDGVEVDRRRVHPSPDCSGPTLRPRDADRVGVALVTEAGCPAVGTRVSLTQPDGILASDGPQGTPLAWMDLSTPGRWVAQSWSSEGLLLDEVVLEPGVSQGPQTLRAPAEDGLTPEGGCQEPVCANGTCDACVLLILTGDDGEPVSDDITLGGVEEGAVTTDEDGQACVEIAEGASFELPISALPGAERSASLKGGTSCARPSVCAQRAFSLSPTDSCAPDEQGLLVDGEQLGWADPAWDGEVATRWEHTTSAGSVALTLRPARDGEPLTLRCDVGAFAFTLAEVDRIGLETAGHTQIRCQTAHGQVLALDLALSDLDSAAGVLALGGDAGELTIGVAVESPRDDDVVVSGDILDGSARIIEWSDTWVAFELKGWISGSVAFGGLEATDGVLVVGRVSVPRATRADTPRTLSNLSVRTSHQTWVHVTERGEGASHVFGPMSIPGGIFGNNPEYGNGPSKICVSCNIPFDLRGEDVGGFLVPVFPRKTTGKETTLAGNDTEASASLAALPLRSLHREVAERMYLVNGQDPRLIWASGTILGQVLSLDPDGNLRPAASFGSIYLRSTDGRTIPGLHIQDDLRASSATAGATFAFLAVPPNPPEAPYTLVVEDAHGDIIPDMTMQIVLPPGSALVLMP